MIFATPVNLGQVKLTYDRPEWGPTYYDIVQKTKEAAIYAEQARQEAETVKRMQESYKLPGFIEAQLRFELEKQLQAQREAQIKMEQIRAREREDLANREERMRIQQMAQERSLARQSQKATFDEQLQKRLDYMQEQQRLTALGQKAAISPYVTIRTTTVTPKYVPVQERTIKGQGYYIRRR